MTTRTPPESSRCPYCENEPWMVGFDPEAEELLFRPFDSEHEPCEHLMAIQGEYCSRGKFIKKLTWRHPDLQDLAKTWPERADELRKLLEDGEQVPGNRGDPDCAAKVDTLDGPEVLPPPPGASDREAAVPPALDYNVRAVIVYARNPGKLVQLWVRHVAGRTS